MLRRFRDTQQMRAFAVGRACAEEVLVETWDIVDGAWVLKRLISLDPQQIVVALEGITDADRRAADLDVTPPHEWPAFPIPCGGESSATGISVVLDLFNDRLNIKLSKGRQRNGQWLKIGVDPVDSRELMLLLVAGYDFIVKPPETPSPKRGTSYDDEILY
jgi:hypothetical protein